MLQYLEILRKSFTKEVVDFSGPPGYNTGEIQGFLLAGRRSCYHQDCHV